MKINSLKIFHKILISGLIVVLCFVFLESCFDRRITYRAVKGFIYTTKSTASIQRNRNGGAATLATDDNNGNNEVEISEATAVVLWWTPFIDEMEYTKNCGNSVCFFTGNRKYFHHEKLKVIISQLNILIIHN